MWWWWWVDEIAIDGWSLDEIGCVTDGMGFHKMGMELVDTEFDYGRLSAPD